MHASKYSKRRNSITKLKHLCTWKIKSRKIKKMQNTPPQWNVIIHFPRNLKSCKKKPPSISHLMRVWDFFQFLLYSVHNAIMVLPRWNLVHLLILQSIHLSCCKIGRQFLTPCFCNQNTTTKAGHVFLLLVKITVIYSHKSNLELGKLKASKIKKKNTFFIIELKL